MRMGNVWIRADGNAKIGVGHQMRCLSIADAFRSRGVEVTFLVADEDGRKLPQSRGYDCVVLHTDYRRMEEELPQIKKLVATVSSRNLENLGQPDESPQPAHLLLVDSYFATKDYVRALGAFAKVVYLDDYGREAWPVDGIINYNIYGPKQPYGELYPRADEVLLLLGSRYAPLRKEFAENTHVSREKVQDVLITTGGADAYNVAGQLVERLVTEVEGKQIRYHVISGVFHTFREQLYGLAAAHKNIIIHENVTWMSELMVSCDVAVSAAGSTLYELCASGVPTAYFWFVENQELPGKYFAQETGMISCGDFSKEPEETLERLYEAVRRLEKSETLRRQVAESMVSLTDGRGAERIVACLEERFFKIFQKNN